MLFDRKKIVKEILKDVREDLNDEEILHLLLEKKLSNNPEEAPKSHIRFGQAAADHIAKFAGSWAFILTFTAILILWMVMNTYLLAKAFDPYPYILLNLVLSCIAAVQAPLIMMSQNRQEEKDRFRAENDYKVNLKTEFIIQDLHDKIDTLLAHQDIILKELDEKRK